LPLALATAVVTAQTSGVPAIPLSARLASATRVASVGSGNGTGYWLASADGGVQAFGTAHYYGSMRGRPLDAPIIGIVATVDARGYWLVAKDGAVFSFGDADFEGSLGGKTLASGVVGLASSNTAGPSTMGPQGPAGAPGITGTAGATGATGTGTAGATGATGTAGTTGATGLAGATGTAGATGITGAAGATGATGTAGTTGATGTAGATGATGSQGPARVVNYAYIYNLAAQTVAIEADVTFDGNGPMSGFSHVLGTSTVSVTTAGVYEVNLSVSTTEVSQFAVTVNGVPVPQETYGSGAGVQQNNGQAILVLGAGDVIRLRNHSSAAAVGLPTVAGGTQANVNASLLIEQLG
jgi:BclA C-terminal domain/Collagen triple helix repeat (20 copies)